MEDEFMPTEQQESAGMTMQAISELRTEMRHIGEKIDELKGVVENVIAIDKTVAQIGQSVEQLQKNDDALWKRRDEDAKRLGELETEMVRTSQATQNSISQVDNKLTAATNRARGAAYVIGTLSASVLAAIGAATVWVLSHTDNNSTQLQVQAFRIDQLEHRINK